MVTSSVNGTSVLFYGRVWKLFFPQFRQVIMFLACQMFADFYLTASNCKVTRILTGADPGFFQGGGGGGVASIKQQYAINFVMKKR